MKEFIFREFGIHGDTPGRHYRSVQFEKVSGGLALHVDLLVSPYWDPQKPQEFYNFLSQISKDQRDMYVCSVGM